MAWTLRRAALSSSPRRGLSAIQSSAGGELEVVTFQGRARVAGGDLAEKADPLGEGAIGRGASGRGENGGHNAKQFVVPVFFAGRDQRVVVLWGAVPAHLEPHLIEVLILRRPPSTSTGSRRSAAPNPSFWDSRSGE
jgi:hypothetical protein